MFEKKVSIILYVHNAELSLKECIDSIIYQSMTEIELICVDDGSTDNSLSILDNYAQRDNRIKILTQEYNGIGVSKNKGLEIASGEYLLFIDADVFFKLTMINDMYNRAIETDSDIVVCCSQQYDNVTGKFGNVVEETQYGIKLDKLPTEEVFSYIVIDDVQLFLVFNHASCDKLFKTSFIRENGIKFQNKYSNSDIYFQSMSLISATRISVITDVNVYYRFTSKILLKDKKDTDVLEFYKSFIFLKDKLIDKNIYDTLVKQFLVMAIEISILNLNNQKTYESFQKIYNHLYENFKNDFFIPESKDLILTNNDTQNYNDFKLTQEITLTEYLEITEKYFIDEDDTSIKVSVIIPVYNVEKYLAECLDSVINQTLTNIEIICINDGSTDDSTNILRKYAQNDNRIIILHQENQGPSVSRNNGVKIAKGHYIYFLDSDDMIVPYALEKMFNEAAVNNLDMIFFNSKVLYQSYDLEKNSKDQEYYFNSTYLTDEVLSGAKMYTKMLDNNRYRTSSCLYLTKNEFIKNEKIKFIEGILHEDEFYMFQIILVATRVKHINEQLFIRRVREKSITTQDKTYEHFYGIFTTYIMMLEFINKFEYTKDVENAVISNIKNIFNSAVNVYKTLSKVEQAKVSDLTIIEKYYFDSFFKPEIDNLISSLELNTKEVALLRKSESSLKVKIDALSKELSVSKNEVKILKKLNDSKDKNSRIFFKTYIEKKDYNKINGQLKWARGELSSIRNSFSYKIGRLVTWFPRKIISLFK